ncbi:ChbG/HpnK family deacetylase [Stappia sp.]|uniref:ChbG/HpnK family deacetylase n=1 Tax=Stappia sp. TaxID=1870903 RepID=UPI0025EDDAFA|nr:ChbG/HpnK family deacetylase [Stappia sp.]
MKRIQLTAPDYGLTFGIDRALRQLAQDGLLSAIGCVVASDLWSREYLPLRDAVDAVRHHTRVGLTLTLTGPHAPLSVRGRELFGEQLPRARWWRWRDRLRLVPDEVLAEETDAQFTCFEEFYQRPAEFLHVGDDLLACPRIARVVLKQTGLRRVRPSIVSPFPTDPAARPGRAEKRLARLARENGLRIVPRAPSFPTSPGRKALEQHVWRGLNGQEDGAVVLCQPGEVDDRLRRSEPRAAQEARQAQLDFLRSQAFSLLIVEKDIFLY